MAESNISYSLSGDLAMAHLASIMAHSVSRSVGDAQGAKGEAAALAERVARRARRLAVRFKEAEQLSSPGDEERDECDRLLGWGEDSTVFLFFIFRKTYRNMSKSSL